MFFYSLPKTENPAKNLKHLFENPFMFPYLISEHYVPATKKNKWKCQFSCTFLISMIRKLKPLQNKREITGMYSVLQLTNNPIFSFINGRFGVCSGTAVGMIDPDLCVWY